MVLRRSFSCFVNVYSSIVQFEMNSMEIFLNRISSPAHLIRSVDELKVIQIPKFTLNILKLLRNVLCVNNNDLQQFKGLIIVFEIFNGGLKHEFTGTDWAVLHQEFSKSVISTFGSILHYKRSDTIKQKSFCDLVLKVGELLLPIVLQVESVRKGVINEGFNIIVALICLSDLDFVIRKAIFLLVKPILTKIDSHQRSVIMESSEPMLSCLANLVITCGDYETQEGLILVLMRFSLASKKKLSKISKWFQMHLNDLNLIKILDYHDFDVTCREFLNTLNSAMISDAKVITIPAVDAYANEIHLQKPLMNKYRELWVDFSTSTGTIHTVCDMNGGAWLRLSIERANVKKVTSSKRIMNESNVVQFLIELTTPLKVVLQSSEKYIATLTFMFMASLKIIELEEVFFKQCYKEVYEDEKSSKINTAANIRSLDLSTRHEECLCNSIRSLSSIRSASSNCKKHCQNGGKKCDTPNLSPVPRSHLLATSTPKAPLLPHHSLNMKKGNSGKSGTSYLKNMSESDYLNNAFLYNKFCNPNKWRKGSLIKYQRDTLLTDEDRKFKEMCEAKLIEAKDQLLNSSVSDTPKETDKNKNISNIGKNQCLGIKIPPNKMKVDTTEGRQITETQDRYTLPKDDKNEASDDSPYILINSKGAKTSAIPASMNTSSSLKNDSRHSMRNADSNKQEIDSSSRLHRMKKLLAEGVSSGNKFGLPLSQKFSGIVPSSSEISNSKENKKIALQPSKLNILRPPSPVNRIIDESNATPPCGLFKHPSADKNIRKPELNHINLSLLKKKSVFGVNTRPLADITNSYNSTNKISEEMSEPQEKKQKTLEIPPLFSKQKGQYEFSFSNKIFNESHFLKYDLSVDKGSNKNKQLKNSENLKLSETPLAKMKTPAECKSSSTTEFPPSDIVELNSGDLSMKFSSIKKGGIKAYEWNNSRSTTDQDSLSSSEFKKENNKYFGRNFIKNKNTFILEAAQCDKSNSCKEAVLELKKLAPQPGSGIINHNSQASDSSIHCRYPNKTYGNKSRGLNLLETSSDKIFRSLKSNEVKSSPSCIADKTVSKVSKKRKLFNPNNSIEEIIYSSQEKDNLMEVSNLTPFKCNEIQEERVECLKKKPNKSSRKNQKPLGTGSGLSKILNKFSSEGKAKPQIRRRSLRNKTKVKYVEMSSDDLENMSSDSGAVEPLGTLNENLKTKTDSKIQEINEDKRNSSPNAICESEGSDQVTENRLRTNKQPRITQEKVVPDDQDNSNQELKAKVSNGKISSSFENESSKAKEISSDSEKLASLDAFITESELCPNPSCRERSNLNSSKEVVESPVKLLPDCSTVVEEPVPIADGSPRLETNGTEEGVRAEVHFIGTVEGVNKPGTDTEISIVSSVNKTLKEVELVTKTSSADFQKKCSEVKENLVKTFEALNHSFDDFIDSILNTISDANHRLSISQ